MNSADAARPQLVSGWLYMARHFKAGKNVLRPSARYPSWVAAMQSSRGIAMGSLCGVWHKHKIASASEYQTGALRLRCGEMGLEPSCFRIHTRLPDPLHVAAHERQMRTED
jgi:hypothetical protein